MSLIEKVKSIIDKQQLLIKGDKVIVSVSGGPDSLTLLHLLWRLSSEYDLDLHVFHLDHMFRGEESKEDADYVARFADELGISRTIQEYDVPDYIDKTGFSKQLAARKIRYKLCNELAEKIEADKIAVGQHADDQAETVLINFLRGAGLEGLSGIKPIRENKFIRPLLGVWKKDIENYCQKHDLNPRIDSSNLEPIYLRNKIRLELLPYLENEFNSSMKENLNRMAKILRVENSFLQNQARIEYNNILIKKEDNELLLDLNSLNDLDLAIQRRVIREAIGDYCGDKKDYYFKHIKEIEELVQEGKTGSYLHLPQDLRVKKEYKVLKFFWKGANLLDRKLFTDIYSIPGKYKIGELNVEINLKIIEATSKWKKMIKNRDKLYLDQELIGCKIKVRNRKDGDRFQPLGMQGSKKLKDFLIDEKISREDRDMIPIFTTLKDEIVSVGDLRIDEKFKVTEQSKKILSLEIKKRG
jgi:tRNA(Ile)-lysidine synthase